MSITHEKIETIPCRNCRTLCNAEDNFCPRCGERLRGAVSITGVVPSFPSQESRSTLRPSLLLLLVCAMLFVSGLLALLFGLTQHSAATGGSAVQTEEGFVWFYNARGQNDAVAFRLRGLPHLPQDEVYVLWLINPHRPDQLQPIGPLTPDKTGAVSFASDHQTAFNPRLLDLRLVFPKVQVTVEHVSPHYLRPPGRLVLQGQLAPGTLDGITLTSP